MGKRGKDRYYTLFYQRGKESCIDTPDIAHKTIVNILDGAFVRQHHVAVRTGQTYRVHTACLHSGHDILVHKTAINHSHYIKHGRIGYPATIDHTALYTKFLRQCGCRTSAAMDKQLVSGNGIEIVQELSEGFRLFNYLASDFYYDQRLLHIISGFLQVKEILNIFYRFGYLVSGFKTVSGTDVFGLQIPWLTPCGLRFDIETQLFIIHGGY